jgi:hypothetical protein
MNIIQIIRQRIERRRRRLAALDMLMRVIEREALNALREDNPSLARLIEQASGSGASYREIIGMVGATRHASTMSVETRAAIRAAMRQTREAAGE